MFLKKTLVCGFVILLFFLGIAPQSFAKPSLSQEISSLKQQIERLEVRKKKVQKTDYYQL